MTADAGVDESGYDTRDACATRAVAARRDRLRSSQPPVPELVLPRWLFLCAAPAVAPLAMPPNRPIRPLAISTRALEWQENPEKRRKKLLAKGQREKHGARGKSTD